MFTLCLTFLKSLTRQIKIKYQSTERLLRPFIMHNDLLTKTDRNTWRVLLSFLRNYTKTGNISKVEISFPTYDISP